MVGRTKYAIPSLGALHQHYNTELLQKKKTMREEIASQKGDLEGRMTVKDYKLRQIEKAMNNPEQFLNYISNFKDCATIFSQ